jgi:hypothetical protein
MLVCPLLPPCQPLAISTELSSTFVACMPQSPVEARFKGLVLKVHVIPDDDTHDSTHMDDVLAAHAALINFHAAL